LTQHRQAALAEFRALQAGLRTRAELLHRFKQRKQAEARSYDDLVHERREIYHLLLQQEYFLQYKEQAPETLLRWKLLRHREHHCAVGNTESCDFFYSGYHNEDELKGEGFPLQVLLPGKRFLYTHPAIPDPLYLATLSGTQRIHATGCSVKDLLPDDSARIYTKLGEYHSFMQVSYSALCVI
jgi:hypothetical protein